MRIVRTSIVTSYLSAILLGGVLAMSGCEGGSGAGESTINNPAAQEAANKKQQEAREAWEKEQKQQKKTR